MRDYKDMHWYLWEAISLQARDMVTKGILNNEQLERVNFIDENTQRLGVFTTKLRRLACEIEEEIIPFEEQWQEAIEREWEEFESAP